MIEAKIVGVATRLDASNPAAKQATLDRLHDWLRALPGEHDVRREAAVPCARHGVERPQSAGISACPGTS